MFNPLPDLSPFACEREIDLYFHKQQYVENQAEWRKKLIDFINKPSSKFYIQNDLSSVFFMATGHGTNIGDNQYTKIPFSSRVILLDQQGNRTSIWSSGECKAIFTKDGSHAFHCDIFNPWFSSNLKDSFGPNHLHQLSDTKLNYTLFQNELKASIEASIQRIKEPFTTNADFYSYLNPEL